MTPSAGYVLPRTFPGDAVTWIEPWESLERDWCGEASGFTEWLRLESEPEVLRSVAIDFVALPEPATTAMLADLRLPLRRGMRVEEVFAVCGSPRETLSFVGDRTTYEFRVGSSESYDVSCTVHHGDGLIYITVHTSSSVSRFSTWSGR
nr:hypothetical protein GCM10020063_075480 [Dactylosporangium thailandense]